MDPIKEAFSKIKDDMNSMMEEIAVLRQAILELHDIQLATQTKAFDYPTQEAIRADRQTDRHLPVNENKPLNGLRGQNTGFSIGNDGVPTDKPTDKQTNQQVQKSSFSTDFKKANEVLESLDTIKKEIRLRFKRLTSQEMAVFELIYSLDSQSAPEITYKLLAQRLSLSESSMREYVNKLIKKGIPIDKVRLNNKTILLRVSQDLKNLASLETILRLREI